MASITLPPSTPPQLCSSNNGGVLSPTKGLIPKSVGFETAGCWGRGMKLTCHCQATSIPSDHFPAIERRKLMNLLLFGAFGLPAASILVPFSDFFSPPGGGTVAKDVVGDSIVASEWLRTHGPGDKTLTLGLKGDPTYLMVENNTTLAAYGINAVCTHLGCIVPWNTVEKKFTCPCHGSQYNNEGSVIKGPALLSLELANVDIEDDKVVFAPCTETNFRTGDAPWWS